MESGSIRWRCARCDVSVGLLDGTATELPASWTRAGGSTYCLICSRQLVGDAALESAPTSCSREERYLLRREAVIRFEIDRAPLAPNRVIAQACRTSPSTVASVRRALDDAHTLDHPTVLDGR